MYALLYITDDFNQPDELCGEPQTKQTETLEGSALFMCDTIFFSEHVRDTYFQLVAIRTRFLFNVSACTGWLLSAHRIRNNSFNRQHGPCVAKAKK